jgi:hypothetical protein
MITLAVPVHEALSRAQQHLERVLKMPLFYFNVIVQGIRVL